MNKNKAAALFLAVLMAVSATGCSSTITSEDGETSEINSYSEETTESETAASEISETVTEPIDSDLAELEYLKNNFPEFDGSTSAIPLEASFHSKIFGISEEEAKAQVYHTKTHEAFNRFMKGEVDIVLTVPMTDEQEQQAKDKGAEMTPVAMEGFVFCVNKNNPVESLTMQQIKDIYSGKITNWKDVGGEDMAILAYQRNQDSGSQTLMNKFMGDTPLMDAPTELVPMAMGELMDAVAVYDNAAGAIGYSVYSYAAQMYANTKDVKFIAVDGVAPSNETMENGSYPLLSVTYALYDGTLPEDGPVKRMVKWMTSPEGQQAAREAGYIPANGGSSEDIFTPLLDTLGTGMKRPDGYTVSPRCDEAGDAFEIGIIKAIPTEEILAEPYDEGWEYDGKISHGISYEKEKTFTGVTFENSIKDEKVSAAVNDWLNTNYAEMESRFDPEKENYSLGYFKYYLSENETVSYNTPVFVDAIFRNGYLSLTLRAPDGMADEDGSQRSAVFDLKTGEMLKLSDMFFEGTDFLTRLNSLIEEEVNMPYGEPVREYAGLREGIYDFDLNTLVLDLNNPYTEYQTYIYYYNEMMGDMVTAARRDISGMFEDEVQAKLNTVVDTEYTEPVYTQDTGFVYSYFGDDTALIDSKTAERINGEIDKATENKLLVDSLKKNLQLLYEIEDFDKFVSEATVRVSATVYGDIGYTVDMEAYMLAHAGIYYDIDSGRLLTPDDFLKDGWREASVWEYEKATGELMGDCDAPDISDRAITMINGITYYRDDGIIGVRFSAHADEDGFYTVNVPKEYLVE
ncbi:MAG: substrate-binding domain-containing protein [Oscillospiraceae bacterium]|nr:substrate-binding domain-containing protein [Oscillospiraceae bacterium]